MTEVQQAFIEMAPCAVISVMCVDIDEGTLCFRSCATKDGQ